MRPRQSQSEEARVAARLNSVQSDCAAYSFAYSGVPAWSSEIGRNVTYGQISRIDVAHLVWPLPPVNASNITSIHPNTLILDCYCLWLRDKPSYTGGAESVEFLNPHTGRNELLCEGVFTKYSGGGASSFISIALIVVVNEIMKASLFVLVDFEGHETLTEKIVAHTFKLFLAMFANTGLIAILVSGNLDLLTGGRQTRFNRQVQESGVMSGDISDLDSKWYLSVGAAIVSAMLINSFAFQSGTLVSWVQTKLIRCLDRDCSFRMTRTHKTLQVRISKV